MRSLIVDDELVNRILFKRMISSYSEIDLAENGKEAVEAFTAANSKGKPYDVILLDIMMPVMNGKDALLEMRRIENQLKKNPEEQAKIIVITAMLNSQDVIEEYYKDGCSSYMTKPINSMQLLNELKNLGVVS